MPIHSRPERVLFRFSGPDAQKLLNDVVTGHIVAESGPASWWALLSPQGKIQAEGLSGWAEGAFWLDVAGEVADAFLRRMRMYKLRAQVEIEDMRGRMAVGWSPEPSGAIAHADPRAGGLGAQIVAPVDVAGDWIDDNRPWLDRRIGAGVSELGADFAPDTTFPHDIGMDILGGIDFGKGCYVGQEVVSRMKHRGTARRRPVIVSGLVATAMAGLPVMVGEREAGAIGTMAGGMAVAVLRLDRIMDPQSATVGGLPVMLRLPDWATYRFGESAGAE